MTVIVKGDYSDIDAELDRLADMPTARTKAALDAVLHSGFVATQEAVHVQSGALKATGVEESEIHRADDAWEGTITYGTAGGEDSPVGYAIYEKERDVGGAGGESDAKGDHDFMRPLEALDAEFRAAILEALRP